jgi:hypothetical protein
VLGSRSSSTRARRSKGKPERLVVRAPPAEEEARAGALYPRSVRLGGSCTSILPTPDFGLQRQHVT